MLEESVRNWLNELAIMKATENIDPDPDIEMSDEEREYYEAAVESIRVSAEALGPDDFANVSIDIGYDN